MMDILLFMIMYAPFLVLLALLWTFFAAIRYTSCMLRKRRGEQVKDDEPMLADYETKARHDWRISDYAMWLAAWEKEQERER